jgi:hypothetical protein
LWHFKVLLVKFEMMSNKRKPHSERRMSWDSLLPSGLRRGNAGGRIEIGNSKSLPLNLGNLREWRTTKDGLS